MYVSIIGGEHMEKRPNAANITHGLAQLGGGSKKEGGGGMMKGIENAFKAGVQYANQLALDGQLDAQGIVDADNFLIEDKEVEK